MFSETALLTGMSHDELKCSKACTILRNICNISNETLASVRNVSACSTKPISVKYFVTSDTDQLEASGGSPVNVVDSFGRITTVSTFGDGTLNYTNIPYNNK